MITLNANKNGHDKDISGTIDMPECFVVSTCGHALVVGDAFYVHRTPAAWHYDPGFTGGPWPSPSADSVEVLCESCHTKGEGEL